MRLYEKLGFRLADAQYVFHFHNPAVAPAMKIGSFDTDRAVLVVAEIGNNHEGDFELAAEMVREAAQCGVGAVKFQTVRAADLVRRSRDGPLRAADAI